MEQKMETTGIIWGLYGDDREYIGVILIIHTAACPVCPVTGIQVSTSSRWPIACLPFGLGDGPLEEALASL